jgi:hypothetical protein
MARKTPQDLVGHKIPTEQEITEMRAKLKALREATAELGPPLPKADRKRVSRPRRGSEKHAASTLELADKHQLKSKNFTTEKIRKDAALYQAIEPVVRDAYLHWLHVRDVYLQARSEYWDGIMHFHGALSHLAESDPDLSNEIDAFAQFMSNKPSAGEEEEDGEEGLD